MRLESQDLVIINEAARLIEKDYNANNKCKNSSACYCEAKGIGLAEYKFKMDDIPYYVESKSILKKYRRGQTIEQVKFIISEILENKINTRNHFKD